MNKIEIEYNGALAICKVDGVKVDSVVIFKNDDYGKN